MAYTISRANPMVTDVTNNMFDVIVSFDGDKDRFYVLFTANNSGYVVPRSVLVGWEYKYTSRIEERILDTFDTEEDVSILFTNRADNEINLIWMANCELF